MTSRALAAVLVAAGFAVGAAPIVAGEVGGGPPAPAPDPCPPGFVLVVGEGDGGELAARLVASAAVRQAAPAPGSPPWCRAVTEGQIVSLPADWRPAALAWAATARAAGSGAGTGTPPPLGAPAPGPVPGWLAVAGYDFDPSRGRGTLSIRVYPPSGDAPRTDARTVRPEAIRRVAGELLLRDLSSPETGGAAGSAPEPRIGAASAGVTEEREGAFRVAPGSRASFTAAASRDADGDRLRFHWTCAGSTLGNRVEAAEGETFDLALPPGFYACALSVSDGTHEVASPFAVLVASRADVQPTMRISVGGGGIAGSAEGAGDVRVEGPTLSGWRVADRVALAGPWVEGRFELDLPGRFASVEAAAALTVTTGGLAPAGWFWGGGRLRIPLAMKPRLQACVGGLAGVGAVAAPEDDLPAGPYARLGAFAQLAAARSPDSAAWVAPRLEALWMVSLGPPGADWTSRTGEHAGTRGGAYAVLLAVDLELRPFR